MKKTVSVVLALLLLFQMAFTAMAAEPEAAPDDPMTEEQTVTDGGGEEALSEASAEEESAEAPEPARDEPETEEPATETAEPEITPAEGRTEEPDGPGLPAQDPEDLQPGDSQPQESATETNEEEGFTFDIEDGKAAITGWTGTETELVLPSELGGYPVARIAESAFEDGAVFRVTLSDSLESIGERAFACSSLSTVTFESRTTAFCEDSFADTQLTYVYGPECSTARTLAMQRNCVFYATDASEHMFEGEGTVLQEPTCTEEGTVSRICSVCGATVETAVPAAGHDCEAEWSWTDTAGAEARLVCRTCGETAGSAQAAIAFFREGGELIYTASAEADGEIYTDRKTVPLTAPICLVAGEQTTLTATEGLEAYRWQYSKNGGETWTDCISEGHDRSAFTFKASAALHGRIYRCVTTENGTDGIAEATELSVLALTKQPVNVKVAESSQAAFTVTAVGDGVSYRWQVSKDGGETWRACTSPGNDTADFSFTAKTSYSGWMYRCVVKNIAGSITSRAVTLRVIAKPAIAKQPVDRDLLAGSDAVFAVTAKGDELTYRWQVSKDGGTTWKNCTSTGYDKASFSFTAKEGYSGWMYRCAVSNLAGSVTTKAVSLSVTPVPRPTVTAQPQAQNVRAGRTVSFTFGVSGLAMTYQWQVSKDGGTTWKDCVSAGHDTDTLTFTAKTGYHGWMYRCVVSNYGGTRTSKAVKLSVYTKKIYLSPSNQDANTFITGNANEGDVWNDIAARLLVILQAYDCDVMIADFDMRLEDRAEDAKAWEADVYIAMHSNAYARPNSAWGVEVYYDARKSDSAERRALAQCLLDELGTLFYKRGLVTASYLKDCRLPEMPSVIVECGYHDTVSDANRILNNKDLIAELYCKALVNYLGLHKRPAAP